MSKQVWRLEKQCQNGLVIRGPEELGIELIVDFPESYKQELVEREARELVARLNRDAVIIDQICTCRAYKSQHRGLQGHGPCEATACTQFTFLSYVYAPERVNPNQADGYIPVVINGEPR